MPLQGANPTPSFGGFGLRDRHQLTLTRSAISSVMAPDDAPGSPTADLPDNPDLFQKLRALRKTLADQRGVPAFVIFGDVSLRQMAAHLPQSRESFSQISGVGSVKLEEFSERFLEVIRDHATTNGLVEIADLAPGRGTKDRSRRSGSTQDETRKLVSQKHNISDIAELRGVQNRTIVNHIAQLVVRGEALDLAYLMPSPHRLERIQSAFQQAGDTRLTPVRDLLGESYSYDEIALARIGMLQRGLLNFKGDSFVVKESP